ncbi:hypothetical protein GB931_19355 [Modestobacter sp. I12A-02628]|uniref:ABC-2 type transport system permease protein n=1 Tax=Goekera deserti TaxID=2497753 RepID=A0A7K3WFA8_9ACTN|nr:DUF6297 family protein [Goekera deserti]MPR00037.1 hypothetical protein [Goekera deserti]NDI49816.1 hypothetical protein [Goekera deserti]NEL55178.1 hypothetical protein [Goekera deserti]
MRRFTRRASAARADTSWLTLLGDLVSYVTGAAVVVAALGSTITSLREDIRSREDTVSAVLPGSVSAAVAGLVVAAALAGLLDQLGPVSATPPAAAWWLPLPAARRGLLRGELWRIGLVAVVVSVVLGLPVVLSGARSPTVTGVLLGLACAGLLGAAVTGLLAAAQGAGRGGRVSAAAGLVTVLAVALPALGGTAAHALGAAVGDPPYWLELCLPSSWPVLVAGGSWWLLVPAALLAVAGLVLGDRGLAGLRAGVLRAGGETVQYASASVLSLDTRAIGRALARPVRRGRRPAAFGRVRTAAQAVVASDLAVLTRSPWRWGQLVVGCLLPVLVARTEGLGESPPLVGIAVVLGWALAAVALGEPSRHAQAAPAADRMLPLADREVVRARAVVPLVVLVGVCGVSALLVSQGAGLPVGWLLLGAAAAPAWAGAAVRGGYRPELDWSGPVVSSPMGAVPSGVGATLVRGLDVGVVGTLPFVVALLVGEPTQLLLTVQLGWALLLGAVAVHTAHSSRT